MKPKQLLLLAIGSLFLLSQAQGQPALLDESNRDLQAGSEFKCPLVFGAFSDPEDCSYYYICIGGASFRKKCRLFHEFDIVRRTCLPALVAICGSKRKSTAPTTTVTKSVTATTPSGNNFVCSSFMGSFPHPDDCSKYYYCFLYQHTLRTCPKNELFDAVKKSCQPEGQVHCGTRQRPPDYSTTGMPDETTTESVKEETVTTSTESDISTTISESTEEIITTTEYETDTPTTSEITEEVTLTTEALLTGPPDHTCIYDDLDCIITDTGDINKWFRCPEDVGSYAHPSSDKLFIFCMNWIPSVKKCGLDLVFSRELSTCIEIKYLL